MPLKYIFIFLKVSDFFFFKSSSNFSFVKQPTHCSTMQPLSTLPSLHAASLFSNFSLIPPLCSSSFNLLFLSFFFSFRLPQPQEQNTLKNVHICISRAKSTHPRRDSHTLARHDEQTHLLRVRLEHVLAKQHGKGERWKIKRNLQLESRRVLNSCWKMSDSSHTCRTTTSRSIFALLRFILFIAHVLNSWQYITPNVTLCGWRER